MLTISKDKELMNEQGELVDFIYNVQEQSLAEANEILSRKYV